MAMSSSTQALTSCSACGIAFPAGAHFCPSCGTAIDPLRQSAATRRDLSTSADPLIGQVLAERYRILSLLGRGGMGVVYRVEHVHIGKLMAMKLLAGELANDGQVLKRFEREAKAVSKLGHPNTVQIFDFGNSLNLAYLVMEYLPGRDLSTVIYEQGALDFQRVARIAAQIAGSVEEAHRVGIIHRDIKPENVMLIDTPEQRDFVKVLDFGIAKLRDAEDGVQATERGHLIGTPFYMAPEQIKGESFDHRVDVYALGALMYKAVTGVTPFVADTPMEVLGKVLNERLMPVRERAPERAIPVEAERIIAKALARDPAQRHESMAALREELLRYLHSVGIDEITRANALGRAEELATRDDVESYERGTLRTSRYGKVLGVLALLAVSVGAYVWSTKPFDVPQPGVEVEPNDEPSQATLLKPGQSLAALIGKRKSPSQGDFDVYRIALNGGEQRVADIALSALPNIDLALDLVQLGSPEPIVIANSGKLGEPERIPNVYLGADTYYLRVREVAIAGKYPTENVSDEYTLKLSLSAASYPEEREPNDDFGSAQAIVGSTTTSSASGLIGWAGDRDVFCADAKETWLDLVEVSGVANLDLVLTHSDRTTNTAQRIDRGGIGEAERLVVPGGKPPPGRLCFTVSAQDRAGAATANPNQRYELTFRHHGY
jgi:eukaryotic-like serine/threonine-protein kinase